MSRDRHPTDVTSVHWRQPQIIVALIGFVAFAVLVLSKRALLLEPDDLAYRASIIALSHGHIWLSESQMTTLSNQLASNGSPGIVQWHHLASGRWISEKNPGYPFFAVLFYMLHILRATPLFYGAFACVGLLLGARKWLGGWAGTYAVWIYCFSGAALTFAWRDTMPSFTDASLIAAGFGLMLWVFLSQEQTSRLRTWVGLLAFLSLEGAVFIRYTNVIELVVASLGVILFAKPSLIKWSSVALWLTSVVLFGLGVLAFDNWAYGSPTSTGYSSGEISFSFSSLWPNLKGMPRQLTTSMPMWIIAFAALVWICARYLRGRKSEDARFEGVGRDASVGAVLALGWLGLWFLYLNYTWTAPMVSGSQLGGQTTVHVIRFYLPALGLIALLATWVLVRFLRPVAWIFIAGLLLASVLSFLSMSTSLGFNGSVTNPTANPNTQINPPGPANSGATPPSGGGYGYPGGGPPKGKHPNGQPPGGQAPSGSPPAG